MNPSESRPDGPADARPGASASDGWVLIVALGPGHAPAAHRTPSGGRLGFHISGSAAYLQQVTLWLTFVGGLVATRHRTHLTLSTAELLTSPRARLVAGLLAACVSAAVLAVLAYSGVELVRANREQGKILGAGIPEWASECVIPVSAGPDGLAGSRGRRRSAGVDAPWPWPWSALAFGLGLIPPPDDPAPWAITRRSLVWPVVVLILAGALLGRARCSWPWAGWPSSSSSRTARRSGAVSAEVYRLIASPTIPAIPLLTTAGFVLAARASRRRASCAASRRCSAGCRAGSRWSWSWPAPPSPPAPAARGSRSWPWAAWCCRCWPGPAIRKGSRSGW